MSKPLYKRRLFEADDEDSAEFMRELRQINPEKVRAFLNEQLSFDPGAKMWKLVEYSDYTGDTYARANAAHLLEKYPGIVVSENGPRFNAVVVGIREDALAQMDSDMAASLYEDIKQLKAYGALDLGAFVLVQAERRSEAWEHRFRSDFLNRLNRRFPELAGQAFEEQRLRGLFEDARDISGAEWTDHGGAETVDMTGIVESITPDMIQGWLFPDQGEIDAQVESLLEHREYAVVTAPASPDVADAVLRWGQMFITPDRLYDDPQKPGEFGREDKPHVTVKFGLHEKEPSPELLKIIEETQPFEIEVGTASLFENDEFDVVKFDIEGEGLHALNERISELKNSDEYPEYHPHMTVAYVTKGTCRDLIGKPLLEPNEPAALRFLVKSVVFSSPAREKTTLFLGKPNIEEVHESEQYGDEEMDIASAKEVYGTTFKEFTDADVEAHGGVAGAGKIFADRSELIDAPTDWQKRGLQQTSSGYGAKLNTGLKIAFNGKIYRLYSTTYGNAGSVWFVAKGRKIFVN